MESPQREGGLIYWVIDKELDDIISLADRVILGQTSSPPINLSLSLRYTHRDLSEGK